MSVAQPEAILDWLEKEMGYRPLGPYLSSSKVSMPSSDAIRRVCRGNMIPVFDFLLKRVKSEKTVDTIRRNILVHGREDKARDVGGTEVAKIASDRKDIGGRRKKANLKRRNTESTNLCESDDRERALHERESAEKEVGRLRQKVRHQRKELNDRMLEVSREEADRKRMLDERSNSRHKQVMMEAYGAECDVTARIFTQYHKLLCSYVNQAKYSQRSDVDSDSGSSSDSSVEVTSFHVNNVKSSKPTYNEASCETNKERDIRKACELLAEKTTEMICDSLPAYKGNGIHPNPHLEASKLGIDFDGDIPDDVQDLILKSLKCPPRLLLDVTASIHRLKLVVAKEIEKTDIQADAEILRYSYVNNRITDASPGLGSPLPLQLYGNGNNGVDVDMHSKGTQNQRFEIHRAHVKKFMVTEDQLNKAAEARNTCQNLLNRLSRSSDTGRSFFSQNISSFRQMELEVWEMEREAAALRASLITLTCEAQRLNMLRLERKEAEDLLKKKLAQIEEFDARRSELKFICDALTKANTNAAAFWSQKPLSAREHATNTIIPACARVASMANRTKDLIIEEVSAFSRCPDNRVYMLPSTPQALLDSMSHYEYSGIEAVVAAEKNAILLTARAGSGDQSAVPSIFRVSAALQYPSGSEASLASVLESMRFCLKLRGSEASVLEELSKAIDMVHTRRDLVESGRSLLDDANLSQKEHKSMTSYCSDLASEQDEVVMKQWLPELKNRIADVEKSLDNCKYIECLLDEWWEQPASTLVDWVTVDGKIVGDWHNQVKQLLAVYDKQLL